MNIAIFASGSGTNAENIIQYFQQQKTHHVKIILSNKTDAYVHTRAKQLNVPSLSFSKNDLENVSPVQSILEKNDIDFIVLAGFLLKIPDEIVDQYEGRILNIHPALLPNYGGKGMYGDKVHEAVIAAKEKESGITIHQVNKLYDSGSIVFQAKCEVKEDDTPNSLAQRVHALEYEHFPKVIESIINTL
ncbi:MAG: phosphoribosylglycinamide formyltransferase [Paludibacteraceae bacterium]|nr:phosphoribosylglycinamide formyltransferase [Paludibacteraceae bacterium]